jgi:hypothetical protein
MKSNKAIDTYLVTKWKLFELKEKKHSTVTNPGNQSSSEESTNYKMLILTKHTQSSHS